VRELDSHVARLFNLSLSPHDLVPDLDGLLLLSRVSRSYQLTGQPPLDLGVEHPDDFVQGMDPSLPFGSPRGLSG
jgi:hypothetical protein